MSKSLTFFQCENEMEYRWAESIHALHEAEHEQALRDADADERATGRCDVCQEWPDHRLTLSGGEMHCDDCLATGLRERGGEG